MVSVVSLMNGQTLDYETPRLRPPPPMEAILVQAGHRLGSAGLILLVIAVGLVVKGHGFWHLLGGAVICLDLGALSSFIAWWLARSAGAWGFEARGVFWFNTIALIAAVLLATLARLHLVP